IPRGSRSLATRMTPHQVLELSYTPLAPCGESIPSWPHARLRAKTSVCLPAAEGSPASTDNSTRVLSMGIIR
ncbi:hypothetical protein KI387_036158, partial [Taxus chinensis]